MNTSEANDGFDFYCGPTQNPKTARGGYSPQKLYSWYEAKFLQEIHIMERKCRGMKMGQVQKE